MYRNKAFIGFVTFIVTAATNSITQLSFLSSLGYKAKHAGFLN